MGEHGFCACCTTMVHGSICNSEYMLCGTPILSINRHQESFHYLSFLWQVGVDDFSAGLSLSLSIAGFVQMGLGMRLHQKVMRMISLSTFGIVLLKLVFDDLWAMPTIGKIIVFIILGLILLILSFLYQKLKDVLFKNDEDEVS